MRRSLLPPLGLLAVVTMTLVIPVTGCGSSTPTRASSPNAVAGAKGLVAVLSPTVAVGSEGHGEIDAVLTNAGTADDVLVAVSVPDSFATGVTVVGAGDRRIPVPSGGLVVLSPSGSHIALDGVRAPATGSTVPVTFTFDRVGDIIVDATVR